MKVSAVIEGQKINRLTAIKFVKYNNHRKAVWLFKCECGNEVEIVASRVKNEGSKSCGCFKKEKALVKDTSLKSLFRNYKGAAKNRGRDFQLNIEQFFDLIKQNCFYCGIEPQSIHIHDKNHIPLDGGYVYNGIDRVNNKIGYIVDNCVACCNMCNTVKHTKTDEDFLKLVKMIALNKGIIQ